MDDFMMISTFRRKTLRLAAPLIQSALAVPFAFFFLFAVCSSASAQDPHHLFKPRFEKPSEEVPWSYTGPSGPQYWGALSPDYELCSKGESQSPIDLSGAVMADLNEIKVKYFTTRTLYILNDGHTVKIDYSGFGELGYGDTKYKTTHFHFHIPSEHNIDGAHYPMEMQFEHRSRDGRLAILSIFIVEGGHNKAFDVLWRQLPTEVGNERVRMVYFSAANFLPADKTYYTYAGSLAVPPCSENVRWLVLKTPIEMSAEQMRVFKALVGKNNRPVQKLHGRTVFLSTPPRAVVPVVPGAEGAATPPGAEGAPAAPPVAPIVPPPPED